MSVFAGRPRCHEVCLQLAHDAVGNAVKLVSISNSVKTSYWPRALRHDEVLQSLTITPADTRSRAFPDVAKYSATAPRN